MPRLKSWGLGGYLRSSLANRIREVLSLTTAAPDSLGMARVADIRVPLPPRLWNYLPEGPRINPFMAYHHQYEFNQVDDVSTLSTWDQTAQGGGKGIRLLDVAGDPPTVENPLPEKFQTIGNFQTGSNAGDFRQYQEKNFNYSAEEGLEQELWFRMSVVGMSAPYSSIFFGYTPTSDNAITDRNYGLGFQYDPADRMWYFQIDNVVDGEKVSDRYELESTTPIDIGFKLHWTREQDTEHLGYIQVMFQVAYQELLEFKIELAPQYEIRGPLRLTFGAENALPSSVSVNVKNMKEVIRREYKHPFI